MLIHVELYIKLNALG